MSILQAIMNFLNDPIVLTLIGAIISAIIATNYYFNKWEAKDLRIGKKAFRSIWISSKKLEYNDLSGRKEFVEKNPSTHIHLTKRVQEHLDKCENILLISEPMAGKTYFTVNHLKQLENTYVLIPGSDKFDEQYEFIPRAPSNAIYKIVLIDDIYSYLNAGITRLPSFIEKSMEMGYTIWANTITGPEFEVVRNNLPPKLLQTFERGSILIPSTLTDKEALAIAKSEGINELQFDFDRNIGSIFYPTKQIKDRYDKLDGIGRLILLVIKQLFLIGIYRIPSEILKSNLRKLFDYYEPNISSETISKKIDELKKNGFLLNSSDARSIRFEEKYLRKVVEPNLKVKDFMNGISEIFPRNLATYTQAMQSSNNYDDVVKIYHEMCTNGIQPGVRTFSVLIGKADNSDIGLTWLNEMEKLGVQINEYIEYALFRTTKGDTEKKKRVIAEFNTRNIEVNEKIRIFFNSPTIQLNVNGYGNIINLSGDYKIGRQLFDEMIKKGIEPNKEIYGTLINLSGDYKIGRQLFDEMIKKGIEPNKEIYGTLINLSGDYKIGRQLFDEMIENGIIPDKIQYGTLINLSKDYKIGRRLFDEMIENGIIPNKIQYGTLINLSKDYKIGRQLFDEMIENGIIPDKIEYGTLINLSKDYKIGRQLFDEMIENGIIPDKIEYGTLINLSKDYKIGRQLFDEMIENGIVPDKIEYGTLINLSKDYKIGKQLFDEMIENGIEPNEEIYGTLINLSKDYKIGKQLFDEMIENGIEPNVIIYTSLIQLSKNIQIGRMIFNQMLAKKMKPNTRTYNALIWLCRYSYQEAVSVMDIEMATQHISPDAYTFSQLMTISRNFEIAIELFQRMRKKNIDPTDRTYDILVALADDDNNKQTRLKEIWGSC